MFRFREIREIKTEEKIKNKREENYGYKEIKPQNGMTFEKACQFWDDLFANMEREG